MVYPVMILEGNMDTSFAFYKCPTCSHVWSGREDFVADHEVSIEGYQADLDDLDNGLFYFTHSGCGCGGVIVLKAELFTDLYSGRRHPEPKTGSDECPGFCLRQECLDPCGAHCSCGYVREIIQMLKK